jgi:hypothetical protein
MGTHGIRSKFGTKRFKKVTRTIEDGFESKHFEVVGSGTAKLAAVAAAQDAATLFLAAAEAFKIAKKADWRKRPENVTSQAYRQAREVRKFRISKARVVDVKDSLKRTLDEYTSSRSGGS